MIYTLEDGVLYRSGERLPTVDPWVGEPSAAWYILADTLGYFDAGDEWEREEIARRADALEGEFFDRYIAPCLAAVNALPGARPRDLSLPQGWVREWIERHPELETVALTTRDVLVGDHETVGDLAYQTAAESGHRSGYILHVLGEQYLSESAEEIVEILAERGFSLREGDIERIRLLAPTVVTVRERDGGYDLLVDRGELGGRVIGSIVGDGSGIVLRLLGVETRWDDAEDAVRELRDRDYDLEADDARLIYELTD